MKTRLLLRASSKKVRQFSKKCFFPQHNSERIQVCQNFFAKTLCICPDVIQDAIINSDTVGCYSKEDQRGKREPINKTKAEDVHFVKNHIESFPVMSSHYTRKDTNRKYLDSSLSIRKMYKLYEDECRINNRKAVSEIKYRSIFGQDYNLSFFVPKKDQCLICANYLKADPEKKLKLEENYLQHERRNKVCQNAKKEDKDKATKDRTFMSITLDLQAVLQIPKNAIGQLYYLRKLIVYNLTIYEAPLPNTAYCLCWNEINGKKGSSEIGTCLYYYLANCLAPEVNHITIFSDTCSGQNRNQYISSLLLWAVQNIDQLQIIEQKFLESGHSYMEVDSMHSAVESASKNIDITSMNDWKNVFRNARKQKMKKINGEKYIIEPYKVKEMKYDEMLDLKLLADQTVLNRTKDSNGNKVNWLKIKRIKYIKGEKKKIYFSYDLSEDNLKCLILSENDAEKPLTRSKKQKKDLPDIALLTSIPKVYRSTLPISEAKKKNLIKMCKDDIFPEELHNWIYNLKTEKNVIDRIPDADIGDESEDDNEYLI